MGCDIHMFAEIKKNGTWHTYSLMNIDRDYRLFGLLAGVRNIIYNILVKPKGIPKDIAITTKIAYDSFGIDAHTPSWYSRKEIKKLFEVIKKINKKLNNRMEEPIEFDKDGILYNLKYLLRDKYIEDYRIVFWFDN